MSIHYFWDPDEDNIVQERDDDGNLVAEYTTEPYLRGNLISQNRGGVVSQYHFDSQGSTLALSNDNQEVTDTYGYNAFGEVVEHTGNTVNPFQFGGQKGIYRNEETGDYMAFGRTLSAIQGRWLTESLAAVLNPFAFAGNYPTTFIAVIEEGGTSAKKPPGGHASVGSVCSFATWTIPGNVDDPGQEKLREFSLCQARCVAERGKRLFVIYSTKDIIDYMTPERKCCTIYICGHQGGDKGNLGGIYTYGEDKQPYFIFGPKAKDEDEAKFRKAFEDAGCADCVINIFACGGATYNKEEREKVRKNWQDIADITGCKVCGSKGAPGIPRPAKPEDDGGILGSETCPAEKGRPDWKNECVESKKPIKAAMPKNP